MATKNFLDKTGLTYFWSKIKSYVDTAVAGAGGPTVVQSYGTSTTDVMSQKAVTDQLYKNSNANIIKIGSNTQVGDRGTAVGASAQATGLRSVALGDGAIADKFGAVAVGRGSNATTQGQFDIGDRNGDSGYNSSFYRLLTGLYDPQSDHDGANKGYVDTAIAAGVGKAKELTASDYNYPSTTPDGVALWLLEPGLYYRAANSSVKVYFTQTYSTIPSSAGAANTFLIGALENRSGSQKFVQLIAGTGLLQMNYASSFGIFQLSDDGSTGTWRNRIYDGLDSTSWDDFLSAKQGKVLNDKITALKKSFFGNCATAAGTAAKVVTCPDFTSADLVDGTRLVVYFTNANSYNGQATINVNGTGAVNLYYNAATTNARYMWVAGESVPLVYYDGAWRCENGGIATTTYYGVTKLATSATSTSTSLALTPASLNSLVLNMIAPYPVYSASATYAVGDRVRYQYDVYECNTAITTEEAWTAAHWTALPSIYEQIGDVESVLQTLNSGNGV